VDKLDLDGTAIAADTTGVDGAVNFGIIRSHAIDKGMISFDDVDTYGTALTLTAGNLASVFNYLQANLVGGQTVAFIAIGNSYVFQDGGSIDTVVQLTGVTASGLSLDGLTAGGVWLA